MIKKHMDEAPIFEAYEKARGCPLCFIRDECERQYVDSALGSSVMEPARRVEVNEKGFCERHLKMLYDSGDRLPLALMLDTHMEKVIDAVRREEASIGAFRRKKPAFFHSCQLCGKLGDTMSRYESTLIYIYLHDEKFRQIFRRSQGVCLEHFESLMKIAPREFARDLCQTTLKTLEKTREDVHWYTLKFDYRNRDKPWGRALTASYRAIGLLRGNRNINEPKDQE